MAEGCSVAPTVIPSWPLYPSLHESEVEPANQLTSELVEPLPFKVRDVGLAYRFKMVTQ